MSSQVLQINELGSKRTSSPLAREKRYDRVRALLEITGGYGLILVVLWTPRPAQHITYWITTAFIVTVSVLSWRGLQPMGLRTENFWRSIWVVGAVAAISAVALTLAAHYGTLTLPPTVQSFFASYIGYMLWSFFQQVLILDFFLRRMLLIFPPVKLAIFATAVLFSLAHLPNPILTPLTMAWGLGSCWLFLRYRNLYTLAIAHAIAGICLSVTVPRTITRNMRVGESYLRYSFEQSSPGPITIDPALMQPPPPLPVHDSMPHDRSGHGGEQ
jgi:hypothetical protein